MRIARIEVSGLRHHAAWTVEASDEVVRVPDAPRLQALADAISLAAAALGGPGPHLMDAGIGPGGPRATRPPELLDGLDPLVVDDLVAPGEPRTLRVKLSLRPDPPLVRALRDLGARDGRLHSALGVGAELRLHIGWLFDRDGAAGSPSLLGVAVGDVTFPVQERERPTWLPHTLASLAPRFGVLRHPNDLDLAELLLDAATSPSPEERAEWGRLRDWLQRPPFDLGPPELVRRAGRTSLAFGPALTPLRALGPAARLAVHIATAALIRPPDVLIAPCALPTDHPLLSWLAGRATDEDATLDQVWLAGAPP